MKVINAALLAVVLAFVCLPSCSAQGVRAALVDMDEDEELEEDIFERDLTKKRLKKRCAYPFEVDNDEDEECDEQSLYKPDKWCKKYCFVCPCWDLETYYDWKGNEIDDVCTEDFCGRKDPELPCSKHKGEKDCCDCTKCKFLEIMPWDHPLCKPDIPPPLTCEDIKPKKNDYHEWECDFDDCPKGKECVPDRYGKSCSCKSVEKECEDVKPEEDELGFFCDADCPEDGICVPDRRNRRCECKTFCEGQREVDGCPGECPFTGDVCVPDGTGGCTCEIPCELDPPSGGICGGFCPNGESCVPGAEGESCSCKPECEEARPRDNCDGICPDDVSGESCVEDGEGGCTCEPEVPECQPAEDPEDGCVGICPFTGESCVLEGGECLCLPPCDTLDPEDNDGTCPGFCPFTGTICAPDGDGGCDCGRPCDADGPDDDGVCDGVCPTTGEACVPDEDGESCGCEPLCEFDDVSGGCFGICPETGQSCTEDDGECVCAAPEVCTLEVDKKCIVPTQPIALAGECDGKVVQLALIWRGSSPVQVSGQQTDKTLVNPGESLTLFGPFDGNDQDLFLQTAGGSGTSTFHMSCSDDEMDGPEDCGTLQGNGKKDSGGVNLWELAGLVSTDGGFDCGTLNAGPAGSGGQDECNLVSRGAPSCDTGKPDTITFLFNGGTNPAAQCASSTIDKVPNSKGKFHTDFECSGQVDPNQAIAVSLDGGSGTVAPGQTFTVNLKSIKETTLSNGGGTQQMEFHTSCSQPIAAGLTAGALTIVGLDGQTISNQVAYTYEVTNRGDSDTVVTSVVDDLIGNIIDRPFTLGPGESRTFDAVDNVNTVTSARVTNVVEVTGNTVGSDEECTASDSVTVTITPGPPIGGKNKSKNKGGFVFGQPGFGGSIVGNQGVFIGGGSRRRKRD